MKRGKVRKEEKEKELGPLFPRLHVDDADKGGPRAPPRNKMALYEQLSVPSKRFNPGPVSSLSLPPYSSNGSTMGGLSASSSHDGRHEKSVFSPFYTHSVENVHSRCSSDGMNFNATTIQPEKRLMIHANSRSLDASGSVAECGSVHRHDSLSGKKLLGNKLDANENERSQSEQRREKALTIKKQKKSVPFLHIRENLAGQSNTHKVSPERDLSKAINLNESSHVGSEVQYKKSCGNAASVRNECLNDNGSWDALRDKSESFSKFSLDDNGQGQNVAVDHNQKRDDMASGSPKLRDAERNEACDAPVVDSLSVQEVYPDDMVGSIGSKHFWNTRSVIVNQQRVFAIQVFELHRLIKVQKLIAASPNILLEGNHCLNKSTQKVPLEIMHQESLSKIQAVTARQKDDLQVPNQDAGGLTVRMKRMVGLLPRPSHEVGLRRGVNAQYPQTSSHPGNAPLVPMACGQKPSVWCFHPPGNQWLVPFMPPFQGLVHRPCTSPPCIPNNGYMPPVYGGCCPLSTPPVTGDFMNPAYGIPTSHQQPNIGVPPAVERVSTCNMANPKSESISGCLRKVQASKENKPTGSTEAISGRLQKFQASKESEFQGSAANSLCKKVQVEGTDALPLFSASSIGKAPSGSRGSDNQPRVIKAVPHSARSAPELAARIFQSIQEGRQQHGT